LVIARRRVHGAVFKVVGVLARREKPAGARLGALEHRLGGAHEDVVMALRAPHALVVLSRRELDDEAELLLHLAPKIDGLELRRAVESHTHRLVAERVGVDHDRAKEGDPVRDGMRLDGLDVSVRGKLAHGDELVDGSVDRRLCKVLPEAVAHQHLARPGSQVTARRAPSRAVARLRDGARDAGIDGVTHGGEQLVDADAVNGTRRAREAVGVGAKARSPEQRQVQAGRECRGGLRRDGSSRRRGDRRSRRRLKPKHGVVEAVSTVHLARGAVGEEKARRLFPGLDPVHVEQHRFRENVLLSVRRAEEGEREKIEPPSKVDHA